MRPPVHRPSLRIQRLQSADDQIDRRHEIRPDDWKLTDLGWIFSIAIFFLGVSAAVFGRWVEEGGPARDVRRRAVLRRRISHQRLRRVDPSAVAGLSRLRRDRRHGLGLGYISPVSTLIKWFPDRPGMATGMAIMGFGGAAMIAAPLSVWLMRMFATPTHVGVAETFVVMGLVYACFMLVGAAIVRVPAPGWKPAGYVAPVQPKKLVTTRDVYVYQALKTPQFWLIWMVLCLNVTAGIGVLGQASAMIQEMFPGRVTAAAAGGFVGLLSLFNMGGRFFWASTSDYIGRKNTYFVFFSLGVVLYARVPFRRRRQLPLFVLCSSSSSACTAAASRRFPRISETCSARVRRRDYGRLLTAWRAAGMAGPVLVNYIREYQSTRRAESAGL